MNNNMQELDRSLFTNLKEEEKHAEELVQKAELTGRRHGIDFPAIHWLWLVWFSL